ncbi:MAG: DUF354 domain-containing protein [Deltaproteobacteria bacterium]|nr:DUF354 domain-containing protein [Deltaproteobacteria bacterium]
MRFIIDILHPAHVHFFRNFYAEMSSRGHEFLVLSRDKDCTLELLDAHGIPHRVLSRQWPGPVRMGAELLLRTARVVHAARRFRPDYLLGIMGPTIALAGVVLPARTVVFYDNESARAVNRVVYRLCDQYCTPSAYQESAGPNHVRYDGYHELAYLHPDRFTPDREVLERYGSADAPLYVLRFVSWQSVHDVGEKGLSLEGKRQIVDMLAARGRVVITSESPLPEEFERYRLSIPVEHVHHVLAFAELLVGESSTMASEAAVLGTHALFVSKTGRGINVEQEARYGLVHNFDHQQGEAALHRVQDLLAQPDLKADAAERRERLLAERVDVTQWMIEFFERGGAGGTQRRGESP